jgi:hypothetical protein
MKFYRNFRVREQGFPPELYQAICAMKPDSRGREDFWVESQPGDEANAELIKRLVDFCEANSVPRAKTANEFKAYIHEVVRHYEPPDLEATPLLLLGPQKRWYRERLKRDEAGRLMLPAAQSGVSLKVASGAHHLYVASDSTRKILEAGQLVGLFFRETVLKGTSIRATTEPLWEIDADIKLPKMINSVLNPHSPVPHYYIDERPYRHGEPRYHRADLPPLGKFDIARTFEPMGNEPGMIISQRFYRHCWEKAIPLEARPAWIELD